MPLTRLPVPAPPGGDARRLLSFTWVDALIILIISAAAALTLPAFRTLTPDNVAIFKENRLIATYPLEENRNVIVKGFKGPVEVLIKNRMVSVIRSTCPHQICVKSGRISRPHAQIVCAPNHILVTITSSENDTLDAIVR